MKFKRITTNSVSYFLANGLVFTLIFMLLDFCLTGFIGPSCASAAPTGVKRVKGDKQKTKKCDNDEVLSIKIESELIHTAGTGDPEPKIEVQQGTKSDDPIKVTAFGPILGSMDSRSIKTDLRCSERGMVLKATITRSANFNGAVLQNQNWRPKILLIIKPKQQKITVQTIWSMRLTNGTVVDHAQTPPYPDRPYPIVITKTVP